MDENPERRRPEERWHRRPSHRQVDVTSLLSGLVFGWFACWGWAVLAGVTVYMLTEGSVPAILLQVLAFAAVPAVAVAVVFVRRARSTFVGEVLLGIALGSSAAGGCAMALLGWRL
jgi:hypothetical protein